MKDNIFPNWEKEISVISHFWSSPYAWSWISDIISYLIMQMTLANMLVHVSDHD